MSLRICALALLWALASAASLAEAEAAPSAVAIQQVWKVASRAEWPPVLVADTVILRSGNMLTAHALKDGASAWTARFRKLVNGPSVLAAGKDKIYAPGRRGVLLLSTEGKVLRTHKLKGASSLLFRGDSIFVSTRDAVLRLDAEGQKELGRAAIKGATVLGASGRYATVFSRQKQARGSRLSPNLLQVLDLATGKRIYQFRLLPDGAHKVLAMDGRGLTFVDYTVADRKGRNRRKLYFTEVNYRDNKKLRDLALSKQYASDRSDTIWVSVGRRGEIYVATHGGPGHDANVVGYDGIQRKTLWERLGTQPNLGVAPYQGLLWSAIRDDNGVTKLVGLDPKNGKATIRLPLDGHAVKPPMEVGGRLFVRTAKSLYCFESRPSPTGQTAHLAAANAAAEEQPPALPATASPAATATPPDSADDEPAATHLATTKTPPSAGSATPAAVQPPPLSLDGNRSPPATRPGFRVHKDDQLGFALQLPEAWFLDKSRQRRMGGPRAAIPFSRVKNLPERRFYLGTVQVLTWEAAGRDAAGLWRSIFLQRKSLNADVQVLRVHQLRNVGGTGQPGVVARYRFTGPSGQPVTLRSLCVVSNGVAYELRAWAGPMQPGQTWREIEEIFSSFRVFKP